MCHKFLSYRFLLCLVALAGLASFSLSATAATFYVRTDGGTAAQCNGTANAPVSASPNCAWNNPQWAFPPGLPNDGTKPIALKAGDTLQIASGSYQFGYGSPGATACQSSYAYNCVLHNTLPSNITIQGNCSAPPELWGGGHQYNLYDLTGSSGVTLRCLELTDHGTCIDGSFSGIPSCSNSASDKSAQDGIDIRGANNVTLDRLNIHGLADYGIMAGKLTGTTTVTGVTIRANAWGGWNGDLGGNGSNSKNSGTIIIQDSTIAWNGCTEAWPATTIVGCRGADQGGYGDGLGTALTGGNWRIINSKFLYNTSDGLDLLYADGTGSVLVDRVTSIGNASQQVKVAGPAIVQNSVIVGWCSATPLAAAGLTTLCRASGNAVELDFTAPNQAITFAYNTVTGNGDCLISSDTGNAAASGFRPTTSDSVTLSNNIMLGQTSYLQRNGGGYTCSIYASAAQAVTWQNNLVWNVRDTNYTAGDINKDPQLTDETLATLNPYPLTGSPAIGNAVPGSLLVTYDNNGFQRPTQGATIGAIEFRGQAYMGAGNGDSPLPPAGGATRPSGDAPVPAPQGAGKAAGGVTETSRSRLSGFQLGEHRTPEFLERQSSTARLVPVSQLGRATDGSAKMVPRLRSHTFVSRQMDKVRSAAPVQAGAAPAAAPAAVAAQPPRSYLRLVYYWFANIYDGYRRFVEE